MTTGSRGGGEQALIDCGDVYLRITVAEEEGRGAGLCRLCDGVYLRITVAG